MTWPLFALTWVKNGLSAAWGWISRHPWQAALLIALLACVWLWHSRNEARQDLADFKLAQEQATGAQQRVNEAAETHYKEVANVADTKHDAMVADAWDATARYVAEHRVQDDKTCKAPAPAASASPSVPAEMPARVIMDQADVHACADLYAYSVGAHDWAKSLKMPENLLPE